MHGCIESKSTCSGIKTLVHVHVLYSKKTHTVHLHTCTCQYFNYLTILGNIYTVHFVQHHIFQIIHVTGSYYKYIYIDEMIFNKLKTYSINPDEHVLQSIQNMIRYMYNVNNIIYYSAQSQSNLSE